MDGERIYLRPVALSDAEKMLENTKIAEIRYFTGTKAHFTLEQIQAHIQRVEKDETRHDFSICLQGTNEFLGEVSILDISEENHSAALRIAMFSLENTGKGYGPEAIKLILRFVFEELQLNRLQLEVYSHNPRGIKAYQKVGFVKEGVLREALFINQQFSDEIIMSMLRSDYEKLYGKNKKD